MQEDMFRMELRHWGYTEDSIRTRISKCRRVEEFEGNLDTHYEKDRCTTLLTLLTYTTDDLRAKRPLSHHVPIAGDWYTGTHSLRSSVAKYVQVRDAVALHNAAPNLWTAGSVCAGQHRPVARNDAAPNRNSYDELFEVFPDIADRLCQFGLENSVYAVNGTQEGGDSALRQWHDVVSALENNGTIYVRIRDTESSEFRFYEQLYGDDALFGNKNLKGGGDGNYYAKRAIEKITGWRVRQNPAGDTGHLIYFTVSHVWGNRTKNPLLFTAAWNIVLTPNLIDPFTDEENHYIFAERFKEAFRTRIRESEVVRQCIGEYNAFIERYQVQEYIRQFAPDGFTHDELQRLRDAALRQWDPIPLN